MFLSAVKRLKPVQPHLYRRLYAVLGTCALHTRSWSDAIMAKLFPLRVFAVASTLWTYRSIVLPMLPNDVLVPVTNACPRVLVSQVRRHMCFIKWVLGKYDLRLCLGKSKSRL
eukprot:129180-Amphidinium_carterae.1